MKTHGFARMLVAAALAAGFFVPGTTVRAEESSIANRFSLTIDFAASALAADSDGGVSSFTGMGFGDDGESALSFSYEGDVFGGTATLAFPGEGGFLGYPESPWLTRDNPLVSLDELYAWVKPFGEAFTFTGGIFENTDGLGLYDDDIDDFALGVFYPPVPDEGDTGFHGPDEYNNAYLVNGFMAGIAFGPATLQLLFAPNFDKRTLLSDYGHTSDEEAGERLFRLGGRLSVDAGFGTLTALYKASVWPIALFNAYIDDYNSSNSESIPHYPGSTVNFQTFGVYGDITAVENLGITLGYSGWMHINSDRDYDNPLWSGIDLRAQWTGIEGLSLSTHNNVSFARGVEKDWYGTLSGTDSSFLSLYNAVGATRELTEKFSLTGEIANVLVKYDNGGAESFYDNFFAEARLVSSLAGLLPATQTAEFTAGLRLDMEMTDSPDNAVFTFSVPVGIKVEL